MIKLSELSEEFNRKCKCNMCNAEFSEGDILLDQEIEQEFCPNCKEEGYIMDLTTSEQLRIRQLEQPNEDTQVMHITVKHCEEQQREEGKAEWNSSLSRG